MPVNKRVKNNMYDVWCNTQSPGIIIASIEIIEPILSKGQMDYKSCYIEWIVIFIV